MSDFKVLDFESKRKEVEVKQKETLTDNLNMPDDKEIEGFAKVIGFLQFMSNSGYMEIKLNVSELILIVEQLREDETPDDVPDEDYTMEINSSFNLESYTPIVEADNPENFRDQNSQEIALTIKRMVQWYLSKAAPESSEQS